MKKIFTSIFAGVLMSAFCAACGSNSEPKQKNETRAVLADADVTAFLNEHLPATSGLPSDCFFIEDKESKYVVINSNNELIELLSSSSIEVPSINFDQYTLVVGQYWVGGTGYHLINQDITIGAEKMKLNLTVKIPEGSYAVLCPFYYWGLYPKLPETPIEINLVYEK